MEKNELTWKYQFEGRAWQGDEIKDKYDSSPEKIELFRGKIFFSDEQRLQMLRLLVENVGLRQAIEATAGTGVCIS